MVSLVEDRCNRATNAVAVCHDGSRNSSNADENGGKKTRFAVCLKGLDFPKDDLSSRLAEWIEVGGNKKPGRTRP